MRMATDVNQSGEIDVKDFELAIEVSGAEALQYRKIWMYIYFGKSELPAKNAGSATKKYMQHLHQLATNSGENKNNVQMLEMFFWWFACSSPLAIESKW